MFVISYSSSDEVYHRYLQRMHDFYTTHSGNSFGTNGVGLLVRQELVEMVLEVERYSDRFMKIRMVLGKAVCHVFSAYAPQAGLTAQEKEDFWELVEEEVAKVPNSNRPR